MENFKKVNEAASVCSSHLFCFLTSNANGQNGQRTCVKVKPLAHGKMAKRNSKVHGTGQQTYSKHLLACPFYKDKVHPADAAASRGIVQRPVWTPIPIPIPIVIPLAHPIALPFQDFFYNTPHSTTTPIVWSKTMLRPQHQPKRMFCTVVHDTRMVALHVCWLCHTERQQSHTRGG